MSDARVESIGDLVGRMTHRSAAEVKAQARALGAARSSELARDAVHIAGDQMDRKGVPLLRLFLASAALLIIYIDPAEPDRYVTWTYATLASYTLYSAVAYVLAAVYRRPLSKRMAHWIDLVWHTVLVSLSSGTNSLFFFFYFFDILVASFRCGAAEGLRVTFVSAFLISSVGYLSLPPDRFELNRFLLRPVYLVVLGYMVSYLGGLESKLRRRLALLREVTVLRNPRFGVHETIASGMEKIRAFYDAKACLLVIADGTDRAHWLYEARRGEMTISDPERCPPEMAAILLALPPTQAILFDRRPMDLRGPRLHAEDVVTGSTSSELTREAQLVISTLDAEGLATVPFRYHHDAVGRLYVTARCGAFDESDLDYLSQVIDGILQVTENVRLVDRLATEAADNERRRIARGIHDTVIQPYIGLQLGLRSITQRIREGDLQVQEDLEHLLSLIDAEVSRLRDYVTDLKGMPDVRVTFMSAVRRFARQFSEVTGIDVCVDGPAELSLSERVVSELFQMITEALSNIRRHTAAQRAAIGVVRTPQTISVTIENDSGGIEVPLFEPRSLSEHAQAMGGSLEVHRSVATTAVVVTIPL